MSMIMINGIRSSGKASYFLAIFPYVIMAVLFVRAVTLPGASNGIKYLFMPQWKELTNPRVKLLTWTLLLSVMYSETFSYVPGLVCCSFTGVFLVGNLFR